MAIVDIDTVKEGMILSEDIRDHNSRLLIGKNQIIGTKQIRTLKIWGITKINVKEEADLEIPMESSFDADFYEKVKHSTNKIFKHVDLSHPAMAELFDIAVEYRCQKNPLISAPQKKYFGNNKRVECGIDWRETLNFKTLQLPEIPKTAIEINEIIANPRAAADDISQVVSKSPSLSALMLKIVNSPFFGFPNEIDTITRAVTLIGTKDISSLAFGISMIESFKGISTKLVDMRSFIEHSLACGIIARILASYSGFSSTEQFFVSGLIHDIGKLIIYQYFPHQAKAALSRSVEFQSLYYLEEARFFGDTHADLAKMVAEKWKLPCTIENNISYHHKPSRADDARQAGIIHMADIFANGLGLGNSGGGIVPAFDTKIWEDLSLPVTCFKTAVKQTMHQFAAISSYLQ